MTDTLTQTRPQSAPLVGTASAANAVQRVSYTHDAMIDLIINCPNISQNEIAKHFGYQAAWVSRIKNSDAFLARLAARKKDLIDPVLILTIDEKLRAVASKSLDTVLEKLELVPSFADAIEAANLATKALGYGARQNNLNVQNNFVVAMPAKAASAEQWASRHNPTIEASVTEIKD